MDRQDIDNNNSFLFKEMLKMKRREMSARIRSRTGSPQIRTRWLYPYAQERKYRNYLFNLLNVYSSIAIPALQNNLQRWTEEQRSDVRTDDFNREFQQLINELEGTQRDMFNENGAGIDDGKGNFYNWLAIGASLRAVGFGVSAFNQKQEDKVTKRILGQPFIPPEPWLEDAVQVWSNNNYKLIKSLSDEYIKKLNTIVSEGVADGRPWDAIMKDVRGMDKNITKTRARLLSRDQVGKLNGRLTKRRSQEAGLDLYRWLTAQDERVRTTHKGLNNKICRWDDDTVYADSIADARAGKWKSRSGARLYVGIPGQDIQCRCTSVPVVDDVIDEVDQSIEKEEQRIAPPVVPPKPKPKPKPAPKPKPKPKPAPKPKPKPKPFTNEDEIFDFVESKKKDAVKFTNAEKSAVQKYTGKKEEGGLYKKINQQARAGKNTRTMKQLDSAMDKMPTWEGDTFRIIGFEDGSGSEYLKVATDIADRGSKGIITFDGYTSSSVRKSVTEGSVTTEFGFIEMKIKSKTGKVIAPFSEVPGEMEVLYKRGTKFKVKKLMMQEPGEDPIKYSKKKFIDQVESQILKVRVSEAQGLLPSPNPTDLILELEEI